MEGVKQGKPVLVDFTTVSLPEYLLMLVTKKEPIRF